MNSRSSVTTFRIFVFVVVVVTVFLLERRSTVAASRTDPNSRISKSVRRTDDRRAPKKKGIGKISPVRTGETRGSFGISRTGRRSAKRRHRSRPGDEVAFLQQHRQHRRADYRSKSTFAAAKRAGRFFDEKTETSEIAECRRRRGSPGS